MRLSTLLVIAFHDGSIEIRDRITMEIVAPDNVQKQISGLGNLGFEFPHSPPRASSIHADENCTY